MEIEITQFPDGNLLLEKNEYGKWFVSTEYDGKFYLQENLEDGEIRDMGFVDNLPDAIRKIVWAS